MLIRILIIILLSVSADAQTHPTITSWMVKDSLNPNSSINAVYFSQDWVYLENKIQNKKQQYYSIPIHPDTSKSALNKFNKKIYKYILLNGTLISKNETIHCKKINFEKYCIDGLIFNFNATHHSPIIGFAGDGFPIYGPYGFYNTNGTGNIVRMKSGFHKKNTNLKLKFSKYENFNFRCSKSSDTLDEHNGRFCVTPEYPEGIYCYFLTIDENRNASYPFLTGPTLFGKMLLSVVDTIVEPHIKYAHFKKREDNSKFENRNSLTIFYADKSELIVIQSNGLINEDIKLQLFDENGNQLNQTVLYQGSTIAYFDAQTLYNGVYTIKITRSSGVTEEKIKIEKK